ncbi:MAG TPA: hypothetical protein PLQ32_06170 [Flavihumibacter sp.]|nr:hypothetical protein [Bacteroidota bacterium]HPZ87668.1 hypothetical protein [Flavihumibacter sp.]
MLPDTPLINAIRSKDFTLAEQLLKQGETIPDTVNEFDLRQLWDTLLRNKGFHIIYTLIDNGNINRDIYEYDSFDRSLFDSMFSYMPADEQSVQFVKELVGKLENANDEVEGHTLLSFALKSKADPAIVQALVDAGLRTDFKNTAQDNLINQSVQVNMIPAEKQQAYVSTFLQAGVDLNEPNVVKQTALHLAVERDKSHLLPILLANGAQPNLADGKGNTAFYYALAHKFDPAIYSALAAKEPADFLQRNSENQTALSEFMRMMSGSKTETELLGLLLRDGASLEETAPYYSNEKSGWDWLVEKPVELLQLALEATGKEVNEADNEGNTLLHKVCSIDCNYSQETAKALYKKSKLLLEKGADVSLTNNKDETATDLAMKDNLKAKLVELLLNAKK